MLFGTSSRNPMVHKILEANEGTYWKRNVAHRLEIRTAAADG